MKHRVAMIVATALLASIPLTSLPFAKDDRLNISVVIDDQRLKGKPEQAAAAWMGYAMARANWISEQAKAKAIDPKSYTPAFEEELTGRDSLATVWSELKAEDTGLKDAYLDRLQMVKEAGFLREYVWANLHRTTWTVEPANLRHATYAEWAKANLAGHVVETNADARIVNAGGK